jgi:Flp pilus assembly protein TadG
MMKKLLTRLPQTRHLHDLLGAFPSDRRGNVSAIFAIALLPILGFVGVAIDYARYSKSQTQMQAALDSAALMLSQDVTSLTASQVTQKAQTYFSAQFNHPDVSNVAITATYTTSSGPNLTLTGSGTMSTTFLQVIGFQTLPVNTLSTVSWGNSRLRVALVLDNTGSMAQSGKLSALKTATTNLLTQLKGAVTNDGDVYVSIIPFVTDVNLNPSNYNASWIDWTDWNANNGTCSSRYGFGGQTQATCYGTWTPANHSTWNGCVTDRGNSNAPSSGNYDTNVVPPSATNLPTLYAADQYSTCPQAVMGLSYNWTSMNTLVNSMVANGNTNQAIGLQLGWMSLAGGGPFTAPAMDPSYTYTQVIILLTDGLNTQDRWYTNQSQIDARQSMTCANIKAANIRLFTIQVNTDGSPTSTLLQNCATSASDFFLLTSSSQIATTFNQIGASISQLHISK